MSVCVYKCTSAPRYRLYGPMDFIHIGCSFINHMSVSSKYEHSSSKSRGPSDGPRKGSNDFD
jgi:hypothetical protein